MEVVKNRQKRRDGVKLKDMKLEFKINKYYLVGYAMISKNKPFLAWKRLEERIWEKYKNEPACYDVRKNYYKNKIWFDL